MKVLFVCTGNTCRSPMAQALFAEEMKKRGVPCESRSAGIATYTGSPASDHAVEAMKEIGIDISRFRSTSIKAVFAENFDLYVPMTYSHAKALREYGVGKHKIYMFDREISDPYGGSLDFYRRTRDELSANIKKLADYVEKMMYDTNEGGENDG